VVRGNGLDKGAAGGEAASEPGIGDVGLREQHCPSAFRPDLQQAGTGLAAGRCQVHGDSPALEHPPGGGPHRGDLHVAGQPAAQVHTPLGGFGFERLDGGDAADHEPGVGTGAEGIECNVEGVLVAGQLEVDQRQQQRFRAHFAQGGDEFPGPVRGAGNEDPGALGHPHPVRPGCGLAARAVAVAVLLHEPLIPRVQEAARSAMSAAPRASRTSASSIPSSVAPTSVSPSVAFLSLSVAVPSTAQTTASRCSMLPFR
jgi:hypothetical protein